MTLLQKYLRNESGATAIEYALIAGMISIAVVISGPTIGVQLERLYTALRDAFDGIE